MISKTIHKICKFGFMNTILIELTNQKAYKLLQDMEELNLIRMLKKLTVISSLRRKIKTRMSNEDVEEQIATIREEWK